jgi:hypothetical protein
MASWILLPCLRPVRASSTGSPRPATTPATAASATRRHQEEVSDHNPDETGSVPIHDADHVNEVHAADVDNNLNEPDLTMEKVVQFLLARCRSCAEKRLRYIIYNRRIWSATSDWAAEDLHRRVAAHRARALLRLVQHRARSLDGFLAPGGHPRGNQRRRHEDDREPDQGELVQSG